MGVAMITRPERTWTPADVDRLCALVHQGMTSEQIGAAFGCTEGAINGKRSQLILVGRLEPHRRGRTARHDPGEACIADSPVSRLNPRQLAWLKEIMGW